MNMNTLNSKNVNILDLPDEILRTIFGKLRMIEMFYSLMNVNERFNRLILDPVYIRHLDLTIPPLSDHDCPIYDEMIDRIRTKILPEIHVQITKLILEPCSMKFIVNTIDFPCLTSLSLNNFQSVTLMEHLLIGIV